MRVVRNGLGYRLAWSGFAMAMAASSLHQGVAGQGWSNAVIGAAWCLFAISWFLHPLVPTTNLTKMIQDSSSLAIGRAGFRSSVTFSALGMMTLGLVLRFSNVA